MCVDCKERKPYNRWVDRCLVCLSKIQVLRDEIVGRPCTPFPKKER
jgi:hypothetical protein